MKKLFFCTYFFLAACFSVFPFTHCLAKNGVSLYFYEAGTDFPISEVTVIIPEQQAKFTMRPGEVLPVESTNKSVTLLIFKEGYTDTAVFGFPTNGKPYAKYALYPKNELLPYVTYAETPCEKDILSLFNAYREWIT